MKHESHKCRALQQEENKEGPLKLAFRHSAGIETQREILPTETQLASRTDPVGFGVNIKAMLDLSCVTFQSCVLGN